MTNTHVDLSELHQVLNAVQVKGAKVSDQIGTARQAMNGIIRSEALQGKTGATIVAGINDVHCPVLLGLEDTYTLLGQQMKQAIGDFKSHMSESSDSAVLDHGTLQSVINLNNRQNTFKAEFDSNLRRIYNSVNDLVSVSIPSTSSYDNEAQTINRDVRKIQQDLGAFKSNALESVTSTLLGITAMIGRLQNVAGTAYTDSSARMPVFGDASFGKDIQELNTAVAEKELEELKQEMAEEANSSLPNGNFPLGTQPPLMTVLNAKKPLTKAQVDKLNSYLDGLARDTIADFLGQPVTDERINQYLNTPQNFSLNVENSTGALVLSGGIVYFGLLGLKGQNSVDEGLSTEENTAISNLDTVSVSQGVANYYDVDVGKPLRNGNGYEIEIPNLVKNRTVTVKVENSGGQRTNPYFRVTVRNTNTGAQKGTVDSEGNLESNRGETHIDLNDDPVGAITSVVDKYQSNNTPSSEPTDPFANIDIPNIPTIDVPNADEIQGEAAATETAILSEEEQLETELEEGGEEP